MLTYYNKETREIYILENINAHMGFDNLKLVYINLINDKYLVTKVNGDFIINDILILNIIDQNKLLPLDSNSINFFDETLNKINNKIIEGHLYENNYYNNYYLYNYHENTSIMYIPLTIIFPYQKYDIEYDKRINKDGLNFIYFKNTKIKIKFYLKKICRIIPIFFLFSFLLYYILL